MLWNVQNTGAAIRVSRSKGWLSSFPGLPGFQAFTGYLLVSLPPHRRPHNRPLAKLGGFMLRYSEREPIQSWGCIAELVSIYQRETP